MVRGPGSVHSFGDAVWQLRRLDQSRVHLSELAMIIVPAIWRLCHSPNPLECRASAARKRQAALEAACDLPRGGIEVPHGTMPSTSAGRCADWPRQHGAGCHLPPFHHLPWGQQVTGQVLQRAPRCGLCDCSAGRRARSSVLRARAQLQTARCGRPMGRKVKRTLPDGSGPYP